MSFFSSYYDYADHPMGCIEKSKVFSVRESDVSIVRFPMNTIFYEKELLAIYKV